MIYFCQWIYENHNSKVWYLSKIEEIFSTYCQISLAHTCYKSLPRNNETLIFGGFSLIFIPHSNYEREIYSCIVHFSCFRLRDFRTFTRPTHWRLTFNNKRLGYEISAKSITLLSHSLDLDLNGQKTRRNFWCIPFLHNPIYPLLST